MNQGAVNSMNLIRVPISVEELGAVKIFYKNPIQKRLFYCYCYLHTHNAKEKIMADILKALLLKKCIFFRPWVGFLLKYVAP